MPRVLIASACENDVTETSPCDLRTSSNQARLFWVATYKDVIIKYRKNKKEHGYKALMADFRVHRSIKSWSGKNPLSKLGDREVRLWLGH